MGELLADAEVDAEPGLVAAVLGCDQEKCAFDTGKVCIVFVCQKLLALNIIILYVVGIYARSYL